MNTPATVVELRIPVDTGDEPFAYPDTPTTLAIEAALGGGGHLTLLLDTATARRWALDLAGAVTVAHRETVGDPHRLDDDDDTGLAWLAALADGYQPPPGPVVTADATGPARVAFHLLVEIEGAHLATADLRAGLVDAIASRFNVTALAVTAGEATNGAIL